MVIDIAVSCDWLYACGCYGPLGPSRPESTWQNRSGSIKVFHPMDSRKMSQQFIGDMSNTCRALINATTDSKLSADTCNACYDDGCCPSKLSLFGVSGWSCSSSGSSLVECLPSGTTCDLSFKWLWVVIFVPIGVLIIACVAACICCCRKSKEVVVVNNSDDKSRNVGARKLALL